MKEIEVKILEVDREKMETRLLALGARLEFMQEFDAILYDTPQGDIARAKDLLRLRKEGPEILLTFKKFISDDGAKIREELETEVGDFEQMRTILGHLGYLEERRLRKIRKQYHLPQAKVLFDRYLDEYAFIPEFMEIEVPDAAVLSDLLAGLGLEADQCLSWNTHDLIRHYGK